MPRGSGTMVTAQRHGSLGRGTGVAASSVPGASLDRGPGGRRESHRKTLWVGLCVRSRHGPSGGRGRRLYPRADSRHCRPGRPGTLSDHRDRSRGGNHRHARRRGLARRYTRTGTLDLRAVRLWPVGHLLLCLAQGAAGLAQDAARLGHPVPDPAALVGACAGPSPDRCTDLRHCCAGCGPTRARGPAGNHPAESRRGGPWRPAGAVRLCGRCDAHAARRAAWLGHTATESFPLAAVPARPGADGLARTGDGMAVAGWNRAEGYRPPTNPGPSSGKGYQPTRSIP